MSEIRHKCEANTSNTWVGMIGDLWWRSYGPPINYCPFCGLKLEPPDVKIEVSREAMREIAMELWRARKHLSLHSQGNAISADCHLAEVCQLIDAILKKSIIND